MAKTGPILLCFMLTALLMSGCSHGGNSSAAGSIFLEANDFFAQGNYEASLGKYEKLIEEQPENADRVLFEMGIVYAHPGNHRKSYREALECFRKIVSDYPNSEYRRDSQMMMLQIQNVIIKDKLIAEQQEQIDHYRRGIKARENEIMALGKKIKSLEQKVFELRTEPSRNRDSEYHLSLRISYPNDKDRKRAQDLGVSPGGDIMIHGIKNGLSWVGGFHTEIDWTEGCIAVTNKEIEEIARLVPDGTPVEIRP
ncbi:MAG: tetratricopeptide repeat protein [Desulfobacteraceae bacterium]